ncbi:MAG: hypothetical protein KKA05_07520 [Alphaproteobacteria bacterium]|nr:hypothetical protein [Alphaproteobacteria bacterium]MBU0859686.1 hypothetical protein [Alphaproteobacteria bacterium]
MPIIAYVGGPIFGGESAERDAAAYDFILATEAADKAIPDIHNLDHASLSAVFFASADAQKAVADVNRTLRNAMVLNQYKNPEQYDRLVVSAKKWNPVFAAVAFSVVPVPEEKKVTAAPVTPPPAPRSFMQRALSWVPGLGR